MTRAMSSKRNVHRQSVSASVEEDSDSDSDSDFEQERVSFFFTFISNNLVIYQLIIFLKNFTHSILIQPIVLLFPFFF